MSVREEGSVYSHGRKSGDAIMARRPKSWEEFFRFRGKAIEVNPRAFEEFLAERKDEAPTEKD